MNTCAATILEECPDIVFSYGFKDEYSFVFKKKSAFYKRRARYFSYLSLCVMGLMVLSYVGDCDKYFCCRRQCGLVVQLY
ncbi:hypothetical protein RHMOL_Rhmol10G0220500 [Rhododendron molle]|uniref:Uncharacterized protein n=1 Tax=Rhododendron molle TaxID=49168 RepID=A0ACC0M5F5_RHOML|nr:hypothetical protein RHMOL_Rhmol10G0220500 [Rhododendron molle]